MIRVSDGLYQLAGGIFAERMEPNVWYVVSALGTRMAGPYPNALDARWAGRGVVLAAAERRGTVARRTVTTPLKDSAGILVRVRLPHGDQLAQHTATVRKVHPTFGPFRWHVSTGVSGDSPLVIAAVVAAAHAIDESELSHVNV